ncbi:hypothetical protein BpHYR1_052665 [Brachionus plicatilis]|uniref:Uncharacterized protein n=1 Tax=Brachionus plicatilis TaxID=10195 RepID=A0A3M7QFZ0_BRAPC|nr:hypothetical protein BpHYR1_052665 [Brachionus plicatilis]
MSEYCAPSPIQESLLMQAWYRSDRFRLDKASLSVLQIVSDICWFLCLRLDSCNQFLSCTWLVRSRDTVSMLDMVIWFNLKGRFEAIGRLVVLARQVKKNAQTALQVRVDLAGAVGGLAHRFQINFLQVHEIVGANDAQLGQIVWVQGHVLELVRCFDQSISLGVVF